MFLLQYEESAEKTLTADIILKAISKLILPDPNRTET